MKKILLLLFAATTLLTSAQVIVEYSGGVRTNVDATDVDSVTFYRPEVTGAATGEVGSVALVLVDKSIVYFKLEERPKLVLTDKVSIITDKTTIEYNYSDVRSIMSDEAAREGVSDPIADVRKVDFDVVGRALNVRGMTAGEALMVYGIDGRAIDRTVATDGTATVTLPAAGVYIIQLTRGVAFKILCN